MKYSNLLAFFMFISFCNGCFRTLNPEAPFDFCAPEICVLPGGQGPGVQIYPSLRDPRFYPDINCIHHHTVACTPVGPMMMLNFNSGDMRPITQQIECAAGDLIAYYYSSSGIRTPITGIECP